MMPQKPYPQPVTPAQAAWEGAITLVDAHAFVHGYVYAQACRQAPVVMISIAGSPASLAVADCFRADYFQKPGWHGHHGFVAHLPARIEAGQHPAVLSVQGLPGELRFMLPVPPRRPARSVVVEELLPPPPRWGAADLRNNGAALNLPANREALGDSRLIDALYQFVLERFPSKGELAARKLELAQGWRSPEQILDELLGEPEFAARKSPLACPFDLEFPFPV